MERPQGPLPVLPAPPELAHEEEFAAIAAGLLAEARALRAAQPQADAQAFIASVGRRRWMSAFADYWNIPEDEQLDRRVVAHIDRFLAQVFAAACAAPGADAPAQRGEAGAACRS